MISAGSGTIYPQYNFVNSFKLFDPTKISSNHHYEVSHTRRAEHDSYLTSISQTIRDLIHDGAVQENESFETMDLEEMRETLAIQMYYI